jgi:chemotaxis response regulator CheB
MKTEQLKVGGKGIEGVTVPVKQAENLDDLSNLAKGNVEVITRWANRGYRIECQERSGARDALKEGRDAGKDTPTLTTEIAKLVDEYDPTAKAARGGPRERKPVVIKAGAGGKVSMEDFLAQLAAAGVKVNFAEGADAGQPA